MKASDIITLFRHQAVHTAVYGPLPGAVGNRPVTNWPFLGKFLFYPSGSSSPTLCTTHPRRRRASFTSSATTGMTPSRHPVDSLARYKENSIGIFRQFYGDPETVTPSWRCCLRTWNARDHRS